VNRLLPPSTTLWLVLIGCQPTDAHTGPTPTTTVVETADTGPVFTECAPPAPEDWDTMPLEYAGEEFAFDSEGNLITVTDWADAMFTMTRDGEWTLVAPFESNEVAGVDFLTDGDLVVADEGNGALKRLTLQGAQTTILGSITSPNSVAVREDGFIYSTAFDSLLRVDPQTGEQTLLVQHSGSDLDGVTFSDDFDTLWYNEDGMGIIHRMSLGSDGLPTDEAVIASVKTELGQVELDGMTADVCGNLYALRTDGRIARVQPNGEIEKRWIKLAGANYASALHFGSGVGGWERDHLYVMERTGTLYDIPIGVMGATEPERSQ